MFFLYGKKESPVFSPLDLSPLIWLDASDGATVLESGGKVTDWTDKSGLGNDAYQTNPTYQFVKTAAVQNGLPGLAVDDSDDYMIIDHSDDFLDYEAFTLALVFSGAPTTAYRQFWNKGYSSPRWFVQNDTSNESYIRMQTSAGYSGGSSPRPACFDGNPHVVIWEIDNGNIDCLFDGVDVGISSTYDPGTGLSGTQDFNIFRTLNGYAHEMVFLNKILAAENRGALNTYLKNKWAI